MNKSAFTLAEVLITLVVIGVIAAITVPTLIANYNEKATAGKVKKTFSTLANAMTFVKADGGDMDFEFLANNQEELNKWYDSFLKPRLNVMKTCYDEKGCWHKNRTKEFNGAVKVEAGLTDRPEIGIGSNIIGTILNDGTFITMNIVDRNWAESHMKIGYSGYTIMFIFDINGEKEPNTIGKDIFVAFFVPNKGIVPAYKSATAGEIKTNCSNTQSGYSCINKYLTK